MEQNNKSNVIWMGVKRTRHFCLFSAFLSSFFKPYFELKLNKVFILFAPLTLLLFFAQKACCASMFSVFFFRLFGKKVSFELLSLSLFGLPPFLLPAHFLPRSPSFCHCD